LVNFGHYGAMRDDFLSVFQKEQDLTTTGKQVSILKYSQKIRRKIP